ncbi:UDP-4-amino-4,6-dideoxy-N-acetyl-beta-L-altrosamine transaminase [Shewanella sp. 10N.7]|uniref:UDP-4-amino-4, 6-dideoxy-N-acetyl-beta-L-altrosamine transaminase n=1 Tax=Shewanella sp. 10N.7 TaxID=2885093 RepID=UPI001E361248|nr:UDP-4-amino-4,6-dideoxy-N-acetyl-beta-L-altrosamine transaminase [Shewanella sp. 10N.7]MCC4832686.1 UDP-4-amino-4,6-dideoxy-N-acetyl-beta-L-altrosamine transaminase [Shewanella sp. 10N.7]
MIPYGRQNITQEDIDSVVNVLQGDFLTQGPAVPAFEKSICNITTAHYAIATTNATSALHLACLALNVGPSSRVWTSTISFVASANCARYCGANIDFVDVEANSGNMSITSLKEKLADAKINGTLPNVVIPVHLAGTSCDMQQIHALSLEYNFAIIEDASHAVGAVFQGKMIGSCQYSDITVFSFHPVKIITTAEGGMALTNKNDLAEKMQHLRSHGVTRNEQLMTEEGHGDWYYQQLSLGFNYRMTDMQAALGISQSNRLTEIIKKRRRIAENYHSLLSDLPVNLPYISENNQNSAWHLYIIRLKDHNKRKIVFNKLREAKIFVNVHYIPIHTQPYYQELGFNWGDYPQAEDFYSRIISLPMYPELTLIQQKFIAEALKEALTN